LQLLGVDDIIYHDLQTSDLIALIFTSNGFILLILSATVLLFHRRALHQAHMVILADKAKYDQAWAAMLANNVQRDQVELLSNQVNLIESTFSSQPALSRQFNRCRNGSTGSHSYNIFRSNKLSSLFHSSRPSAISSPGIPAVLMDRVANTQRWQQLLDCGIPDTLDAQQPVDSLDQLYLQAFALNPILVGKVKSWALASGGCFCLKRSLKIQSLGSNRGEPSLDTEPNSCSAAEEFSAISQPDESVMRVVVHEVVEPAAESKVLPPGYVRWKEAKMEGQLWENAINWGSIKSVQRALEKCTRSYNKV
jgi:hypothetical protein